MSNGSKNIKVRDYSNACDVAILGECLVRRCERVLHYLISETVVFVDGVRAEFYVQDMRGLRLNRIFDFALSIFGSFARLMDNGDYKRFFGGLHRHLRSSGILIFDFINTEGVIHHMDWKLKEKGNLAVIRLDSSDFQQQEILLNERHECFIIKNGKVEERFIEIHKLRTHMMREIKGILGTYGFNLLKSASLSESEVEGCLKPKKTVHYEGYCQKTRLIFFNSCNVLHNIVLPGENLRKSI